MGKIWREVDFNGNGYVSLAEIDKMVVEHAASGGIFKEFDNKPALMRAYRASCRGGKKGDWVERGEFPFLLRNMFYFDKLWDVFDDIDQDDDRRIDEAEMTAGLKKLGFDLSTQEASKIFDAIDGNDGGKVLFDEFCKYTSNALCSSKTLSLTFDGENPVAGKPPRRIGRSQRKKKKKNHSGRKPRRRKRNPREKFESFEKDIRRMLGDRKQMNVIWKTLDFNGNNKVSLAEIDKMCVQQPFWQLCNNKPALMRAYKYTTSKSGGGDGDAWVERFEFARLLIHIVYFNKLWSVFDDIDTGDDRRIDFSEFCCGLCHLGLDMSVEAAEAAFDEIDQNDGGQILFDEFCVWYARQMKMPDYSSS